MIRKIGYQILERIANTIAISILVASQIVLQAFLLLIGLISQLVAGKPMTACTYLEFSAFSAKFFSGLFHKLWGIDDPADVIDISARDIR